MEKYLNMVTDQKSKFREGHLLIIDDCFWKVMIAGSKQAYIQAYGLTGWFGSDTTGFGGSQKVKATTRLIDVDHNTKYDYFKDKDRMFTIAGYWELNGCSNPLLDMRIIQSKHPKAFRKYIKYMSKYLKES